MRITEQDRALTWTHGYEAVRIEPWGPNSLRVRARLRHEPLDWDYALDDTPPGENEAVITRDEATQEYRIRHGQLEARVRLEAHGAGGIRFYDAWGTMLLAEDDTSGALNIPMRDYHPLLGGRYRLRLHLRSDADERLYGMGQYQQEEANLKGMTLELSHRNSQASVPFVLSDRGYGFFWHNPAVGRVSFGRNGTTWEAEQSQQFDYWVTAGENPAKILAQYMEVTGKPPAMPDEVLGFWQSKLRYWNQEQLLEVARRYHEEGIPVDVMVCDFFHWEHLGDFDFDPEQFPDPAGMVAELASYGMKLMVSVWPQIGTGSEHYGEMARHGLLVRADHGVPLGMRFGEDSMFYDATNPEAREYVWNLCKQHYYDRGVRIFWLDEAEPEWEGYDYHQYSYHAGDALEVGNIYPKLYAKGFYDGMREAGQEKIVNLLRCAWAGSQKYGALVWSGDIPSTFESLRRQVTIGQQMAMSGIPWWNSDIGGFHGGDPEDETFRELVIRWFQFGTFCPVMRIHGDRKPYQPLFYDDGRPNLHTGGPNEIWSYGKEAFGIMKKYIGIRDALRPYLARCFAEAAEHGTPVMRPLYYDFPEDPEAWKHESQYMFGPEYLVAPVMAYGQREVEVYLPAGARWKRWDREGEAVVEGGRTVTADAPLSTLPVYVRL